jgi:hypothetical protein
MRVQKGSAIHHVNILSMCWPSINMSLGRNRSIGEFRSASCFSKLNAHVFEAHSRRHWSRGDSFRCPLLELFICSYSEE